MTDTSKVTRFEVIDHSSQGHGRDFVRYGVTATVSLQDDGRTLKIFLDDSPTHTREQVYQDMGASWLAGPFNDPSTPPPMSD